MLGITNALDSLVSRLPELEWRLGEIGPIAYTQLPHGLFHGAHPGECLTASRCVDEIKHDLAVLGRQGESRSAHFLADKVSKKINVLLQLCQAFRHKAAREPRASFGVRSLSTRQQWLGELQGEIERLTAQQVALRTALEWHSIPRTPEAILMLQGELGEVTRHLVTAEEAFAVASGDRGSNCR